MILINGVDLISEVKEKITPELLTLLLKIYDIKYSVGSCLINNIEENSIQHIIYLKWDLNTTLVMYAPKELKTEDTSQNENFDDLNITVFIAFKDMTREKLISLFEKTSRMKAFL